MNRKDSLYAESTSKYCSQCSPVKEFNEWHIDLFKTALILNKRHSESFIGEGCNNPSLYKDENDIFYMGKLINGEIKLFKINIEELIGDCRK